MQIQSQRKADVEWDLGFPVHPARFERDGPHHRVPCFVPQLARIVAIELPRLVGALGHERGHHLGDVHLERPFAEEREIPLVGGNISHAVHDVRCELEVVPAVEAIVATRTEVVKRRAWSVERLVNWLDS